MARFTCSCCDKFQSLYLKDLLNHYHTVHSSNLNLVITSNVEGCTKQFFKYNSFYKHIRRNHENIYSKTTAGVNADDSILSDCSNDDSSDGSGEEDNEDEEYLDMTSSDNTDDDDSAAGEHSEEEV